MSFIKDSLGKDETIEEQFEFHWSIWISTVVLAILAIVLGIAWLINIISYAGSSASALVFGALICALGTIYQLFEVKMSERALTSKRFVTKSGVISVHTEETRVPMIETIEVRQGIIDRLLGRGTLKITGTGSSSMLVTHLSEPKATKQKIESLLD
ncbi:PH domain-containing protein [Aliiglaciecola sp. NS0011-25]|uniref:PH domain-containing protein n=1 Tax=Aliiglaciecola sp. NS0011-25 TaxID=3127654 RepID=UPI003104A596